ncbi:MAG: PolC-type DNA polymerase III, partial [Dehalococcoidia bacterium]
MTTPLDSHTFVALDLETTGVDPKSDHIIEVGAVKFSGGTELGTFSRLVNPHRKLSKFIVELTGITQSDVDEAGEWDDIAPELEEFLGDAPIIGHNVSFDASF